MEIKIPIPNLYIKIISNHKKGCSFDSSFFELNLFYKFKKNKKRDLHC
jgi:hypothetical protein